MTTQNSPIRRPSRVEITKLKSRWTTDAVVAANAELLSSLRAASPFGKVDELEDFRGLTITANMRREVVALAPPRPIPLERVPALEAMDFSFSVAQDFGRFYDVEAVGCRFDGSSIPNEWGVKFSRCSFEGADLKRARFRGSFENCNFARSNLSMSKGARGTSFKDCDFSGARFDSLQWIQVCFLNCNFEGSAFKGGSLGGSRFVSCNLSTEKLAGVILDRARFE